METRGPNDFPCLAGLMQDVGGDLPPRPLRGEIKDSREEIEPQTVEFQKGKIDCKGYRTRSMHKSPDGKFQTHTTRSVWESDVVPFFGFAECEISRKRLVDDQVEIIETVNISLANFGDNARTVLPDHN